MTARIQLSRAKGWRTPADTVKVDRATRWGNPWKIGNPGGVRFSINGTIQVQPVIANLTASEAVEAFTCWLIGYAIPRDLRPVSVSQSGDQAFWDHMAARRRMILDDIHMLRGKDLACWCKPRAPCHADVLLALANCDPRQMTDTLQQMRTT